MEDRRTPIVMMSDSCNQNSTLSNSAEIVENDNWFKLSPLRWSKFETTFVLIPQPVGVLKITKN